MKFTRFFVDENETLFCQQPTIVRPQVYYFAFTRSGPRSKAANAIVQYVEATHRADEMDFNIGGAPAFVSHAGAIARREQKKNMPVQDSLWSVTSFSVN